MVITIKSFRQVSFGPAEGALITLDITDYTAGGEAFAVEDLSPHGYRARTIEYITPGNIAGGWVIGWNTTDKKIRVYGQVEGNNGADPLTEADAGEDILGIELICFGVNY